MTDPNGQIGELAGDLKRLRRGFEAGYQGFRHRIDGLARNCKMSVDRETLERCKRLAEAIKSRRRTVKKYRQKIDAIHHDIEAVARGMAVETRRQHGNAVAGFVSALLNLLPLGRAANVVERLLRALGDLADGVVELGGIDSRIQRDVATIRQYQKDIRRLEKEIRHEQALIAATYGKRRKLGCSDNADNLS